MLSKYLFCLICLCYNEVVNCACRDFAEDSITCKPKLNILFIDILLTDDWHRKSVMRMLQL